MNKKRVVGVTITAMLGMGILLSNNVNYKGNVIPTAETHTSIKNIEVAQVEFDKQMQNQENDKIKMATENDKVEDNVSVIKDSNIKEIPAEVEEVISRERKETVVSSRGASLRSKPEGTKKPSEPKKLKSIEEVAKNVIDGDYGNGDERKNKLEDEGYNYKEIQTEIDKQMTKSEPKQVSSVKTSEVGSKTKPASTQNGRVIKAFPHNTFKSYMRWTALSSNSPQGRICASASKDPKTAIMMKDGRYLVALGFAYAGDIGEHIDIVMESGQVIPAIVGDWKAKADTDENNSASLNNGSIVEFIVSSNSDAASATKGSGSYDTLFPGKVKEFRK